MIHKTILPILLLLSGLASISKAAPMPTPKARPDFLPSTPPAEKAIAAYTPGDALGAVITAEWKFPAGHPYTAANREEGLKTNWPGAKIATNIDEMVQFILAAPPADPSRFTPTSRMVNRSIENVRYSIINVMDVPDSAKADALVRVVTAQTDPQKRKQAVELAARMFDDLLDPRLLAYRMEGLDDLTTYKVQAFGEGPKTEFETRWDVKRSILNSLITYLQMNIDKTPFKTPDEAANCAALKAWLMANWTAIANKCAEVKVNPGRKRPIVDHQPWDARW